MHNKPICTHIYSYTEKMVMINVNVLLSTNYPWAGPMLLLYLTSEDSSQYVHTLLNMRLDLTKPSIWDFLVKIEFNVYFIRLYHRAKSETDRVLRLGASALCSQLCHTHRKMRNYGLKVLLCTCIAFPYTTCEPEIKWTWVEPFELNANGRVRIEVRRR